MSMPPRCPLCGGADNILGHEVRGVYDGILVWQHQTCGHAWPRAFGVARRDRIADDYAAALNGAAS